jgi:DinB family protein
VAFLQWEQGWAWWPRRRRTEPAARRRAVFQAGQNVSVQRDWAQVVAEERCPDCGLFAAGVARAELPAALEQAGRAWGALLAGMTDADLRSHQQSGSWSALEYAAHVRDVLAVFGQRVDRALVEDRPALGWWDHEAAVVVDGYNDQVPAAVAAELQTGADRLATIAKRLDGQDWLRTATRRDGEAFTIEGLLRFALHEAHHHLDDASRVLGAGRATP